MKAFNKYWFTPAHQIKGKPVVEFELMPLSQRAYLSLKAETSYRGRKLSVTPEGQLEVFDYAVQNWRGLETPFSLEAKADAMNGVADLHFAIWQDQITAESMRRVVLGEPEIKNS